MKLEVNIQKKYFISILITILVLSSALVVYAGIGDPKPNPGHSASELAGFPDCGTGSALHYRNGEWSCVSVVNPSEIPNCPSGQVLTKTANGFSCVDSSGAKAGCTKIAELDGPATQIAFNVPSECIGKTCKLMLTSKIVSDTTINDVAVGFTTFIQDAGFGTAGNRAKYWFTETAKGTNGEGDREPDSTDLIMVVGGASLYDDHRFFPNDDKLVLLDGSSTTSRLFICN